jgi:hypothetical protein
MDAIQVGEDESRRQRLVGILLIGHDHQDIGSLGHWFGFFTHDDLLGS